MPSEIDPTLVTAFEVAFDGLPLGDLSISEVAYEAAPAAETFRQFLRSDPDEPIGEWMALATLLGRRLANASMPTTSASRIVDSVAEIAAGSELSQEYARVFREVALEGFTRGREEAVEEAYADRASRCVSPIELAKGVWGLVITGEHEAEILKDAIDSLGRVMLEQDADACVVDLTQLGSPSTDKVVALFGANEIAKMLGARCVFVGVDDEWKQAAERANIEIEEEQVYSSMAQALHHMSRDGLNKKLSLWRRIQKKLFR